MSPPILKLLPKYDCGLCKNPTCKGMARRIQARLQNAMDCPFLDSETLRRIEIIEVPTLKEFDTKEEVVEIYPCGEYTKVTLEAKLPKPKDTVFDLFDSDEISFFASNLFSDFKYSKELGYILAFFGETRIHIFKKGKIVVRRAESSNMAKEILENVKKFFWPAVICSCGNTVLDCLRSGCQHHEKIPSSLKIFGFKLFLEKDFYKRARNLDGFEVLKENPFKALVLFCLSRNLEKISKIKVENKAKKFVDKSLDYFFNNTSEDLEKLYQEFLREKKGDIDLIKVVNNGMNIYRMKRFLEKYI